jgi:tetratricopeptide (TPR) repeat protein
LLALILSFVAATAVAQGDDPKRDFLDALGRFSLALSGSYGDEGSRLPALLDALDRARGRWDNVIGGYETAMKADVAKAAPPLAARMHVALGAVYVDRGRLSDALREFTSAAALDASRADAPAFEGLAHRRLNETPAAIASMRRAYALDPSNATLAYVFGRQLLRSGAVDEASQLFRRFRDTPAPSSGNRVSFLTADLIPEQPGVEPFFPPVLYADGFAELQRGDLAGAVAAFRDAVARDPLAVTGIETGAQTQAAAAFRDGNLADAQQRLTTAIELAPDRAEPHRVEGLVRLAARRYNAAIESMRAAVRLDPRDERARLGLADALVASGQLGDAVRELTNTLDLFPTSGRARYALGVAYQRQGGYVDARQELDKAAAMKPLLGLNSIYQTIGALARSQQQYDDAIAAFSARVDLVPNDAAAHRELGEMYFRQSRHEEALAEFTASTLLDGAKPDTHVAIGQVHLREGRFQEAVAAARRAAGLDGANKEAHYLLATALIRLGQEEEGKRELAIYQRLQSEATAARVRQLEIDGLRRDAAVSAANKDYEKAIALLRQALEREPQSAATRVDLGLAFLNANRPADAVEQFTTALPSMADDPDVHAHLAQAYEALGRAADSAREQSIANRLMQEALRRNGAER